MGCVQPFEPEVGEYDSTLVVDGLFTDGADTSTIFLSRSFSYSEKNGAPISGAKVVIEDDQGGRMELVETVPGAYRTDPSIISGEAGRRYRLLVSTPEGDQFESEWELMKSSPPIDELYAVYEEKTPDDPTEELIPGVQIYLSTQDTENNTRYYRWEYEETYQFGLRFPPIIRVDFSDRPGNGQDQVVWLFGEEFEGGQCWKTEQSTRVLVGTTENLTQDLVKDLPLLYVDNTTSRLYIRYSLLVRQYAISETYYDFLRKIEAVNQTTGSLFDPIPNEVFGNIRSSDGKGIPVLGYFAVAGVSQRRIFVNREDLPRGIGAPFGPECLADTVEYNFRELWSKVRSGAFVPYDYHYNDFGNIIGFVLTQPRCARCAASGATNKTPEFW